MVYDDYYEPPDPPVDESVKLRCAGCGEEWHPEVEWEYQGEVPHGGMVSFYTDDAFDCPSCGEEGEEI